MSDEPVNAAEVQAPLPHETSATDRPGVMRFVFPLLAILVCWGAFGVHRIHSFVMRLGSIHEPKFDALVLALVLSAVGIPATYLAYRIALRAFDPAGSLLPAVRQALHEGDRRHVLLALGIVGALLPIFVRKLILNDAPMTDDEASYRFAAQLLAEGKLWLPSPKLPVFFDNVFLINDGKLYSQYFVGWPALLSIGVLLGIPGLINPILSGCTAVVIALIAERRLGPAWGRVAALLYICSPFIAVSAATQMSHIATCLSLALLLYAVDAVADHGATFRMSAVVALTAAFAFFVRPATAVGFGTPLVLSWLFQVLRRPGSMRHLLAFLGAATGPALLFLWVNLQQTGTPWLTGYHTGFAHGAATGFRFVFFGPQNGNTDNFFYFFVRTDFGEILTKFVVVMMRLWHDAWGFPIGLSLALLAPRAGVRRLVGAFVGLLLAHIPLPDAGIDTFGPVHYTELMIVLSLASAAGLQRLHGLALRLGAAGAAPALLAASLFCCGVFYGIPRFATLTLLAADIRAPIDAFESAPPHSIVFTRSPFAPVCLARGTHFVGFRPNNDPRLKNERLWANHIDLDVDRKLLASKPGWKGFLLRHDRKLCKSVLVPFDQATAAEFPPATFLMPGDLSEVPRKK